MIKLFIKNKRSAKKAQIDMQFNWIFVIIIGAVLLGFFFTAIMSASKSSDQKISVSLAKHFETIIFSSGQKSGTLKTYQTPPVTLYFNCDDEQGLYNYYVGDLKARDTKYDLIFAPDSLTGNSVITWTQKWKVPYSVGTFMYITNEDTLFIFNQGDGPMSAPLKKILADFPSNLSTYIINNSNDPPTEDFNFKQYVYVVVVDNGAVASDFLLDQTEMIQPKEGDHTVSLVVIHPNDDSNVFGYGDVFYPSLTGGFFSLDSFILLDSTSSSGVGSLSSALPQINSALSAGGGVRQNPTGGSSSSGRRIIQSGYLGKASLYGAIFSTSRESYECTMKKAFHKLTLLTILQQNKIDSVASSVSYNCKDNLGLIDVPGPKQTLEDIEHFIYDGLAVDFDYRTIPNIYDLGLKLQRENDNLQMIGTCPVIY